jgi:hypothetical protein
MTFAKPQTQKHEIDDGQRLMCAVAGCTKRWTVHMSGDKPKCSEHQWATDKPATMRDIAALLPATPKEPQWYDKDAF